MKIQYSISRLSANIIFLFLIIIGAQYQSFGQSGCHILAGSQDRLYYTPYTLGDGSPTEWISTSPGRGGYNLITNSVCFDDIGPSCVVYKYGTTGSNPPNSEIIYSGTYAEIVDCSLDDHASLLVIFPLCFCYLKLRY